MSDGQQRLLTATQIFEWETAHGTAQPELISRAELDGCEINGNYLEYI